MDVMIRHDGESEGVKLCSVYRLEEVEGVIKTLSRAGGIHLPHMQVTSTDLMYQFVYSEKRVYAEIVIYTDVSSLRSARRQPTVKSEDLVSQ